MSGSKDKDMLDGIDFCWGKKKSRGGANKEIQFYESFTYDGVEYLLYDSVYLFKEGEPEPYVGKLLKIWENAVGERKVKILWFFRRSEISNYLEGVDLLDNEIFLGSGEGKGLFNVNPLEAIAGKCNVVCISKDARNRQPSVEELKMAHYVFYRTFDVGNLTISEKLDEKIASAEVRLLLKRLGLNPGVPAKLDNGDVVAGEEPFPLKETQGAEKSLKLDPSTALLVVRSDKGGKASDGVDADVKCAAGVSSLSSKDDKGLYENVYAPKLDNAGSVALPLSEAGSNPGQKSRVRSPNSDKVSEREIKVSITDKGKSEATNEAKGPITGGEKVHSAVRPSKKLKVEGAARMSSGNGAVGTPKLANASHASNRALRPVADSAINDRVELPREPDGVCDNLSEQLKSNTANKSDSKMQKAANDRGKLPREPDGVCDNLSEQPKSNGIVTNKSDSKMQKAAVKQSTVPKNPVNISSVGGGELNMPKDVISMKRKSEVLVKSNAKLHKKYVVQPKVEKYAAYGEVIEVTPRPSDKSKWFTASPWEEQLKDANERRGLVLLQNLDPTYSSSDVENIIWHALRNRCTAKMVQHTAISSPHSGQAFAVFKSWEIAEKVVKKLDIDCLMLPNGRPLVGIIGVVNLPRKPSQFFGHIVIDKLRQQLLRDSRGAVFTSHSSQDNTVEYEMAIEWLCLQQKSDVWWKNLYKSHGEDRRMLMVKMKSK